MSAFLAAHAVSDSWNGACRDVLARLSPLPDGSNIGFLYVNDPLAGDLSSILTYLRGRTGVEHWVGTVGSGVVGTTGASFTRPALSVLIAGLPERSFRVIEKIDTKEDGFETGLGAELLKQGLLTGLIHADPREGRSMDIVADLSRFTGAYLVGGISAAQSVPTRQIAGKMVEGGVSGVLFTPDVPLATGLTQGCLPVGPVHDVTRAQGAVIKTLDGKPAFDVFHREIADILQGDLRRAAGTIHVAVMVAGSDTGDYTVRNLTGLDPHNGFVGVADHLRAGMRIRFVRREAIAAEQDLKRMLTQLAARLQAPPKAGILISCIARGPALFGSENREVELIRDVLGDIPLTGFYANGEFSHDRLYSYTAVLSLFTG